MKTNYEQIVDVTKIAVDEKQWALNKVLEVVKNNPGLTFEEAVEEVKKVKEVTLEEIIALGESENLQAAANDIEKNLVVVIDAQYDFHEGGTLAVTGAREDTRRATEFIYKWADKITSIMISLDTHTIAQIFHPAFWFDKNGNHPAPYTVITLEDVRTGKYNSLYINEVIKYLEGLDATQKKQLVIWPYHCLQGTRGWLPEQELVKMVYFHAASRKSRPMFLLKGQNPFSEMYGIFKEECSIDGANFVNTKVLKVMEDYDKIYFLGEAKSHCVLESMKQFLEEYATRPDITSKVNFVIDCSSCVAGFEDVTEKELQKLVKDYGIKVVKSTDIQM